MTNIEGIAATLLWFLSLRDLVTGDVQSLPAPGGVRERGVHPVLWRQTQAET